MMMNLQELEKKWWDSSMGRSRTQKEEEDLNQAVQWFSMLGWRDPEGVDAISDSRLEALLRRARAYKKEYEKWKESVRDKPPSAQGDPIVPIDWNSSPWGSVSLAS